MRRVFATAVTAVSLFLAPAAMAETLTDAFVAAYRNSHLLEKQEATLRAADEDVAQAFSTLRPVVDYTIQSGFSGSNSSGVYRGGFASSFELSASLVLLDFGRRASKIEIAKETVLSTREALRSVEQDILLQAVSAYVDVQVKSQIVGLRDSNVRLVTQELQAAKDRFDVGEITRTDVSIAEARLAAARAAYSTAQGDLMIAREEYKAATGAYPHALKGLPRSPKLPASVDAARGVALKTHPAIAQAQHGVTVAELNMAYAKANFAPVIGLAARASTNSADVQAQSFGLQMTQDIYSGGLKASTLRKAIAGRDQARAGLAQAGVQISQAVGNAWANLEMTNALVQSSDRQIRASQTAFDGVKEEASLGARTTLDVLNAEQELLDAKVVRIQAEANRYLGVYRLLSSMGLLTVKHLGLGIPTYDAAEYYNAVKNAPVHSARGAKLDRILEKIGK